MWLYEISTGKMGESYERVYVALENENDEKALDIFLKKTGLTDHPGRYYFEKYKLFDGFCSRPSDCGVEL